MKTVADQIKDLENTRAARVARMEEISAKSIEEGRSMDEAEQEEFDQIDSEIQSLDGDLTRLQKLMKLQGSAKPVIQPKASDKDPSGAASGQRQGAPKIIVNREADEKFQGQMFTRKIIAQAVGFMQQRSPVAVAMERGWGRTNPTLVEVIRASVAGGGTDSGEWGAELVGIDGKYTGDFIEFLYSKTVFDKLPLREVPENVTIKGQDGAATGYWVGQSKAIPVSAQDYSDVTLTSLDAAALAVVSKRLLRESDPSAEMLVRDALVEASAQRIDTTFLGSAAASAGVSPAGLLNGVSALNSSGVDVEGLYEDIRRLTSVFINAKNSSGLTFVMNPDLANAISMLRSPLGVDQFPDINENGGTLKGKPVVTGHNVNANHLILLKASDIWKIGDRGVRVEMSGDATIEQETAPTGATDTPADMSSPRTSMFQSDSMAIKVVRTLSYQKRRTSAVQYVSDADYSQGTSGA